MPSTERTYGLKFGKNHFLVVAGNHCLSNLKKVAGLKVEDLFENGFDFADPSLVPALLTGILYRQIRDLLVRTKGSVEHYHVEDYIQDLIDDARYDRPRAVVDAEFEELGNQMIEVYVMSKYGMTKAQFEKKLQEHGEELIAEAKRQAEEAAKASESDGEPEKKTTKKKASTGKKSKKTPGSSVSKKKSGTSRTATTS